MMINAAGISTMPPLERKHRGSTAGGNVTVYDLKAMSPDLIEACGLTRYLRDRESGASDGNH